MENVDRGEVNIPDEMCLREIKSSRSDTSWNAMYTDSKFMKKLIESDASICVDAINVPTSTEEYYIELPKKHKKRSEHKKRRRSRSPKRYKPRSRSRSPKKHDTSITHIDAVNNGNWLYHFYKYKDKLLDLAKMSRNGIIIIVFGKVAEYDFNRENICDLAKLYEFRDQLCTECFHGAKAINTRGYLACKKCLALLHHNICTGNSPNCYGTKYINLYTYSSFRYCFSCLEFNKIRE
jgi:hypothetical protein